MNFNTPSDFLIYCKKLINNGYFDFVPRKKNMDSLLFYGLTPIDAKLEILDLDIEDYYSGPDMDYDKTRLGEIWVFKKELDGVTFYIKLKLINENGDDIIKCLSFHEDEFK